jgi:hypothetical protein
MCVKCQTTQPEFKYGLCEACYYKPENRAIRDAARRDVAPSPVKGKTLTMTATEEVEVDPFIRRQVRPSFIDDTIGLDRAVATDQPVRVSDVYDLVDAGRQAGIQVWLLASEPFNCDACGAVETFGEVRKLPGYHPIQAGSLYAAVCPCRPRGNLAVWRHPVVALSLADFSFEDRRAFYKLRARGLAEADRLAKCWNKEQGNQVLMEIAGDTARVAKKTAADWLGLSPADAEDRRASLQAAVASWSKSGGRPCVF